jgi:hypothetical protein
MKCAEVELYVLQGISDNEVDKHIYNCEGCKMFQDRVEKLLSARADCDLFLPSEELDNRIKSEARIHIKNKKRKDKSLLFERSLIFSKLPSYLAAAACGVLIAWLVVLALAPLQRRGTGQSDGTLENAFSSDSAGEGELSWGNVSMEEDFFTVATDIELNIVLISNSEEEPDFK